MGSQLLKEYLDAYNAHSKLCGDLKDAKRLDKSFEVITKCSSAVNFAYDLVVEKEKVLREHGWTQHDISCFRHGAESVCLIRHSTDQARLASQEVNKNKMLAITAFKMSDLIQELCKDEGIPSPPTDTALSELAVRLDEAARVAMIREVKRSISYGFI